MKALRLHEYGGPLQIDEIDQPKAGKGQVVVRNLATSFNPIDPGRASGVMRQLFPLELPWIPGGDVSGTVESVGEGVAGFKAGDQVFGYSMTGGAYAEFVAVDANALALRPEDLTVEAGAAVAVATKLTSGFAHDLLPRFSPDGRWIAFTRRSRSAEDVFVVPVEGGEPRRLTYRSNRPGGPGPTFIADDNLVATWTPDSQNVVFLARSMSFNWSDLRAFEVPARGGLATPLPLGHVGMMTFAPDGHTVALTRSFSDFQTRKRYDGGLAPDIYTYDLKTKKTERITDWKGTDTDPMWVGRRIYFLSDRDKTRRANLWVYDLDSKTFREVTRFTDYDIDLPSLGTGSISFQQGGKLYTLDLATEKLHEVRVEVPDDGTQTGPREVEVGDLIRVSSRGPDFTLSTDGARIVFSARGDLFQVHQGESGATNLTNTSNADEDQPIFSPDASTLAYTSDLSGEQEIVLRSVKDGKETMLPRFAKAYLYRVVWSSDEDHFVVPTADGELWLLSKRGNERKLVATDPTGAILNAAFSPNGRWMAFSTGRSTHQRCLHFYDLATGNDTLVSSPMNDDFAPAFSSDGRWLFFVSNRRDFAVASTIETNFAAVKTSGVYTAALTLDAKSPFDLEAVPTRLDDPSSLAPIASLMDRVIPLPTPTADIQTLEVRGPNLFYQTNSAATFGGDLPADRSAFHVFNLTSKLDQVVVDGVDDHQTSANGEKVLYEQGGEWHTADAVAGHPHDTVLRVENLRNRIEPQAEWREMFDKAWRLERDLFLR
jgi:tricorn protease